MATNNAIDSKQTLDSTSSPTFNGLTLTNPLTPANGGSGVSTAFSIGSIVFAGAGGGYAQSNTQFFLDTTANINLWMGANTSTQAFNGQGRINTYATDSTVNDAISMYTSADGYPGLYLVNFTHNNQRINFDAYFDGTNARSSFSGSNYQITHQSNQLQFNYNSGTAAGSTFSWSNAMMIDTSGHINIPTLTASKTVFTDASKNLTTTGAVAVIQGGTGLSSTTTNQILYSSATSTIAGLATANNGILVTSGAGVPSISSTLPNAVLANITNPTTQTFTSGSGTYTTPANVKFIRVRMWGDGGGGGGVLQATSSAGGAGGGGGGGYCESIIDSPAATYSYSVGAGGAAGAAGNNAGTAGAGTTFSTFTAGGGLGGGGATAVIAASVTGAANDGGTATGAQINIKGATGLSGYNLSGTQSLSGTGGQGAYGASGGPGRRTSNPGQAGTAPGGGGGGGNTTITTSQAGGAGGAGQIIVDEFYA
jgi:hypothetical protein